MKLTVDDMVERHFASREAILGHVGYTENWRVLPLDDNRDEFWALAGQHVKFSPQRDAILYWLSEFDDEYGPYGDVLYEDIVHTMGVFRGDELTLVAVDTQTDGNHFLRIFRNTNEVQPPMILGEQES